MEQLLEEEQRQNQAFAKNWGIVQDWSEASRYDASITPAKASELFLAVTEETNGVLTWLKKWW
jgi:hypothetical protein